MSDGYPDPRECLAAFLALGAAEVLAGVKPANLLRISNRTYSCGRNMYQLWQDYGQELLADSPMVATSMRNDDGGVLLLIYSTQILQRRLNSRCSHTFLTSLHYDAPGNIEHTLQQLASRFIDNEFPHEIGVFLGYPLKDVAAFMGRSHLPVSSQRLWKIYGRSRRSETLADLYLHHHGVVVTQLRQRRGASFRLLKGGALRHG
ncbi:MAG: DUF3793 family protein [Thermodesulfobacteriota bacterium]|nr:DUF3793 family protein [Thermodesulfobacteriota bacterium]